MKILPGIFLLLGISTARSQNCDDTAFVYKFPGIRINYPLKAIEANIQGNVIVQYDIDSTCSITNRKVVKGIGYGCDEEALRALDEVEKTFKTQYHSKCCPVKGSMIPIRFRIK